MYKQDEERDGFTVKAMSLTVCRPASSPAAGTGARRSASSPGSSTCPTPGYESAWQFLMEPDRFFSAFGPTTVERHDPMFLLSPTCCWWSGQSWPYATTQTLAAMANLLHDYRAEAVTRDDYFKLLRMYTLTHRKDGRPYIAEAANPDTGSWEGHDTPGHSDHYFHSGYTDLVITGLVGLRPRRGRHDRGGPARPGRVGLFRTGRRRLPRARVSVLWDRKGDRYGRGPGLHVLADGKVTGVRANAGEACGAAPRRRCRAAEAGGRDGAGELRGEQRRDLLPARQSASFTAERTSPRRSSTAITGITSNRRTAGLRRAPRARPIGSRSTSA